VLKKICLSLAAACVIGFFYVFIFLHLVNFPQIDDFDSILNFLNQFLHAKSAWDRVALIFSQHNEHRLAVSNVIILLQYYFAHAVNFKTLALIGDLSLLPLTFIIYKSFKQKADKLLYFFPVIFVIFQMSAEQSFFWAMTALSNLPVYLFAFTTTYFLQKKEKVSFMIALISTFLCVFSQANGIFILPVGFFLLLMQKQQRRILFWVIFSLTLVTGYFFHYQSATNFDAVQFLPYFFYLIGSVFSFAASLPALSFLAGGLIFAGLIFLIKKGYFRQNPVIYTDLLFLLITASVNAVNRSAFGASYALSSRYTIVSILILCFMYLSFLEIIKKNAARDLLFLFSVMAGFFICVFSYVFTYDMITFRENKLQHREILYPDILRAKKILQDAKKYHYFN
jgi:hypothetical protein